MVSVYQKTLSLGKKISFGQMLLVITLLIYHLAVCLWDGRTIVTLLPTPIINLKKLIVVIIKQLEIVWKYLHK